MARKAEILSGDLPHQDPSHTDDLTSPKQGAVEAEPGEGPVGEDYARNPLHRVKHMSAQEAVSQVLQLARDFPETRVKTGSASSFRRFVVKLRHAARPYVGGTLSVTGRVAGRVAQFSKIAFARSSDIVLRTGSFLFSPSRNTLRFRRGQERWHARAFDRKIERYMFVPTANRVAVDQAALLKAHGGPDVCYKASPARVFDWALQALPTDLSRFSFVDFGAGRGRGLILASMRNFKKVTGSEIASDLCEDASMNIAQFPRSLMRCRDVDCVHVNASEMSLPSGPLVLYFYNPFDRQTFSSVLDNVVASYREAQREIYIIAVDYDVDDLLLSAGPFEKVSLPLSTRLRLATMSHLKVSIFNATD